MPVLRPILFPRSSLVTALVWVVLLGAGTAGLLGQLTTAYEEPDLATPVFAVDHLGLDAATRTRLASILAAAVTDYNAALDAKIIGVALRLDPANRQALDAAARRKRNELPDSKTGLPAYPTATVVTYLAGQSAGLRARGGPDNLALAGCLNAIAAEIDPFNAVAKYERTAFLKDHPAPTWAFLKSRAAGAALPETLPLLKRQSKIHGLSVTELPGGVRTGAVLEMLVTAEDARSRDEVGVTISQRVGESMLGSIQEANRAVRLRHPAFGAGLHLTVSFAESQSYKDGPSGGTAFTLLLYSLYDHLKLSDDAAITGALTVDGRVRAVGGVPSKIHAALVDGCRVVAVPKENVAAVSDLPLLYPANTLWKLQIFTVDTLDEALAVMREDHPVDLQKAMDLFAAVQRRLGPDTPCLTAAHRDLVPSLREIIRLAPCHASAAAMLAALEGKSIGSLSLYASLDEVQRITDATLEAALPRKGGGKQDIDLPAISAGVERLEAVRPHLHYRTAELCAADLAALRAIQGLFTARPGVEQAREYRQRVASIQEVERRMASDPALVEELRH